MLCYISEAQNEECSEFRLFKWNKEYVCAVSASYSELTHSAILRGVITVKC